MRRDRNLSEPRARPQASGPLRGPKLHRVQIYSPDGVLRANVFALVANDVVTLQHDYPDFTAAAGWTVQVPRLGRTLTVTEVAGRTLRCHPEGVAFAGLKETHDRIQAAAAQSPRRPQRGADLSAGRQARQRKE